MIDNAVAVILAGGVGSRLHPLTKERAKPAVPFGGKYRIIDFTLTNCVQSGVRRVLVLTQYKSFSLQKHIRDGWSIFNPELGEYITTVPPQMRRGENWYEGTADAIHQNTYLLERSEAEWVIVLSGDHIYRMDYAAMLNVHKETNAALTIACREVPIEDANTFGVVGIDGSHRVREFSEKPVSPVPIPGDRDHALVSMGVYIFNMKTLLKALAEDAENSDSKHDFGHDIIPKLIKSELVSAFKFGSKEGRVTPDEYWRDVGTIDSYYDANIDLLKPIPPMNLYQTDWPIRTYQSQHPPCRTVPGDEGNEGMFINSIASSGVVVSGGCVQHSILFSDVFIDDEANIQNSLVLNNVHVGKRVVLNRCIIDKNVVIPDDEMIGIDKEKDAERFTISENNIVVVPRGYKFE